MYQPHSCGDAHGHVPAATATVEAIPNIITPDDEFLQKIGQNIEQNLANPSFEVETLAEQLKLSPSQLRRKLKALTNQTVTEYVRNYRPEKAAFLLKHKKGNVSDVAFHVGFENLSYFGKVFQEKFNKLPSEWS